MTGAFDKLNSSGPEYNLGRPIGSFIEIVIGILKDPNGFFSRLNPLGPYREPTLFTLGSYVTATIGISISVGSPVGLALLPMLIFSWLIFIGLVHLVAVKVLGGQAGYRASYRVAAYCNFTYLIAYIPYFGLGAQIFGLYLMAQGLAAVHKFSLAKALTAVGIVFAGQLLLFFSLTGVPSFGF